MTTLTQMNSITKSDILEMVKLLSAVESWALSTGNKMPDFMWERLESIMTLMTNEVLK